MPWTLKKINENWLLVCRIEKNTKRTSMPQAFAKIRN